MTTTAADQFLRTTEITGALTPDQAAQLMALAELGDTSDSLDTGSAPSTVTDLEANNGDNGNASEKTNTAAPDPAPGPAPVPAPAPASIPAESELNSGNAVVLAKDGKHTISYEKLEQARQDGQHWKAQAEANAAELKSLREQAQARADVGLAPTTADDQSAAAQAAIDAGADPAIFGDFSEGELKAGIQKIVSASVQAALAPYQQQQAKSEAQRHYDEIYAKHPDAASILESAELQAWIQSQPSYAQAGFEAVFEKGSAAQVNEVFDNFKRATAPAPAPQPVPVPTQKTDPKVQAAIEAAKQAVPASLSSIPGGHADNLSEHERVAAMDGPAMADHFSGKSPEYIEAWLNRNS